MKLLKELPDAAEVLADGTVAAAVSRGLHIEVPGVKGGIKIPKSAAAFYLPVVGI